MLHLERGTRNERIVDVVGMFGLGLNARLRSR